MNQQTKQNIKEKTPYQRPQLKRYGKLADITFNVAGSGIDGGVGFQFK
jgi:hypothetical protein